MERVKLVRYLQTEVIPDANYPGMYRVAYSNGRVSDMVNLTRARDAARLRVEEKKS